MVDGHSLFCRVDAVRDSIGYGTVLSPAQARAGECDQDIIDATAGDHRWYPIYRNLSLGMAFGGLGMTLGALGLVIADRDADVDLLLYGGAAVAVASIGTALLGSMRYKGAIRHDVYKTIFAEAAYAARLEEDTARYNAQIERMCAEQAVAN